MIAYEGDIFGMIPSPPIGLVSLAAYIREKRFRVSILDCFGEAPFSWARYREEFASIGLDKEEVIERIGKDVPLVGISIHSGMVAPFCLDLAREIKKRLDKPVVVGGPHISVNYADFTGRGVDFAVIGEGELPLLGLLQRLSRDEEYTSIPGLISCGHNGQVTPNDLVDMDELPFPAWDLAPLENYWSLKMTHSPVSRQFAPMITSRGCPYDCSFCSTPKTSNRRWRYQSPEKVLAEVTYLKERFGVQDIFIQDDNFSVDPKRVVDICRLLAEAALDVRLSLPSGVRLETMSPQVIDALASGGFHYLCLAPESGSPRIRNLLKKPLEEERLYAVQRQCKRRGIRTGAFIIIGAPGEMMGDLFMTAFMIFKLIFLGIDDVSIFIYSPVPGSSMAHSASHDIPQDCLGLCWSPRWRKDYRKLSLIRGILYFRLEAPAQR
jgi:radical SAM superfamily enzyme YgiQ (UPF0313 family)